MLRNRIKTLLFSLKIYDRVAQPLRAVYFPYKHFKVRKNAGRVLRELNEILSEHTEDYWLAYGTLLGYIRDGGIIRGDIDLDIGLKPSPGSDLAQILKAKGAYLNRETLVEGRVMLQQFYYQGIDFDLFYYYPVQEGKIQTHIWFPEDYSLPQKVSYREGKGHLVETTFTDITTREIRFLGAPFRAPVEAGRMLAEHYGEDFMTPDPNWSHDEEISSVVVNKPFEIRFA